MVLTAVGGLNLGVGNKEALTVCRCWDILCQNLVASAKKLRLSHRQIKKMMTSIIYPTSLRPKQHLMYELVIFLVN